MLCGSSFMLKPCHLFAFVNKNFNVESLPPANDSINEQASAFVFDYTTFPFLLHTLFFFAIAFLFLIVGRLFSSSSIKYESIVWYVCVCAYIVIEYQSLISIWPHFSSFSRYFNDELVKWISFYDIFCFFFGFLSFVCTKLFTIFSVFSVFAFLFVSQSTQLCAIYTYECVFRSWRQKIGSENSNWIE